jgi:hypothetical protein
LVNTVTVSFDGSCDVVTPKATLAASGQLDSARSPLDSPPRCAWTSTIPGMIVFPFTSMRLAPAGTLTEPEGPTAVMRLPSITTVAFSTTPGVPGIGPGLSPAIVTTRAPTRATAPDGLSLLTVNPIGIPLASASSGFA